MKEIYVLVKFELNKWVKIEDWKKMSDEINVDMQGKDWLQFRDSAVDENGNIYCILKWDTLEQRNIFFENMQKEFKEKPEIMKEFAKLADMKTMKMDILKVV